MRVAWVQDNTRPHGGAETSNRCVVGAGELLGFDIVGVTPQRFLVKVLEECDLIVVNNIFEFRPEQMKTLFHFLWEVKKPYVKYEHDSREIARPAISKQMFGESVLNVFLSPHHYQNHRRHLGCEGITLPLAIQTEIFSPVKGVERVPGKAVVVGGWKKGGKTASSLQRFMAEHPNLSYVSVGFDLPGVSEVLPHQHLEDMPGVYSSAEYLIHLPDIVCAGERVVFEAALCGAKVYANENVGHMSWKFDLSDVDSLRETLKQAPFEFWKAIVKAVSSSH